jgi:hypothetical protein
MALLCVLSGICSHHVYHWVIAIGARHQNGAVMWSACVCVVLVRVSFVFVVLCKLSLFAWLAFAWGFRRVGLLYPSAASPRDQAWHMRGIGYFGQHLVY